MHEALMKLAKTIAAKSPVGVYTLKSTIRKGEKSIYEGFKFGKKMNSG